MDALAVDARPVSPQPSLSICGCSDGLTKALQRVAAALRAGQPFSLSPSLPSQPPFNPNKSSHRIYGVKPSQSTAIAPPASIASSAASDSPDMPAVSP